MKIWIRTCRDCGKEFSTRGGRTWRCGDCQPLHRQAYSLVSAARHRSLKEGKPFDLDVEWVKERLRQPCPRTGLTFTILATINNMGDRPPNNPSLDQITPRAGYTKDNVQVVAWWYNCAKQQFSDEEVLDLCKRVVERARS